MIRTEIYIEDQLIDLLKDIGTDFTYTIDDVRDFGSRNTSFSRTISIPATATNNKILGFAFDLGTSTEYNADLPHVNANFTPAQAAKCDIYFECLLIDTTKLRFKFIFLQ
jgi:hypothetical protein